MNIIWVPHTPWRKGAVGRDQHITRHLRQFGHTVATVSWPLRSDWKSDPYAFFQKSLKRRKKTTEEGPVFSVRRVPDITRWFQSEMGCWKLNQYLFRQDIRWAAEEICADVIVSGFSYHMTGYPPFKLGIPFVFDYLDLVDWDNHPSKPDLPYLQNAKAVLGVSERTYRRAQRHGTEAYFLPNGADIGWLREADGHTVRDRHDLREATIVSLIGLSVGEGEGTYFIDAVEKAKQRVPSLHCLLVGDSPLLKNLVRSRDPAGETFTYVGKVDYEEVAEYYAASDIGLYPAPGSTHDDGRSPIKIFEYSAQGTPVVAAPIQEVKRMSFENVILADPSPQSFAKGIWKATQKGKTKAEGIDEYDWGVLARKVEEILQTTRTEKTPVGHKGK